MWHHQTLPLDGIEQLEDGFTASKITQETRQTFVNVS
jgi:hypothetical protein